VQPSKDFDIAEYYSKHLSLEQVEAELGARSLYEYVKMIWPTVEPGYEYIDNWHIQAICEHLQAVSEGEIRRLIINIPPRHMKSLLASVAWPTWDWINSPHRKFLFASYAGNLSIRDSIKCRRLIKSPWYIKHYFNRFRILSDQDNKQKFENDKLGYRLSTSVDGQLTGEGGDIIVIDDPHNVKEAESEAVRQTVLDWWDQAMPTRLNDPKKGAFVIIMQRVHEADLIGHILSKEDGWDHLCLPARYEHSPIHPVKSSIGFADPRTKEGELLWPDRFGEREIRNLEQSLGSYGASAQLQQRPAPAEGGLIKEKYFKLWPEDTPIPRFDFVIQSYDTAFTNKTWNDPTACTTWGVFTPTKADGTPAFPCAILCDAWSDHLEYPDLRRRAKEEFETVYGEGTAARRPDIILIEEKGSGQALVADLQRAQLPIRKYNPFGSDKTARVHQIMPILELGRVYLPASKDPAKKGKPRDWCMPFLNQCLLFPNGKHDDYVDTLTQALILLRDMRFITVEPNEDEDPDAEDREYTNPYAA